ncbi:putative oxidoreductase [Elusimicrobium minutum Pei191]|uniref:Putative oxidoreductase n=1 Tax=Elusimicrobium minutum (strain Pei191) TaxID=445932 RepID=B2KE87_ELUMP|nr:aldo/keto reductase [Elusimicrobium minutum]ACC98833.1 putative oxidoreductase [Elusimicrobium minutum Pei191]
MVKRAFSQGENLFPVALGTWAIGGNHWGGVEDKSSIEALEAAIDSGFNIIDTAPVYGYGHSEELVGRAIKGKRDKVFIATKCGLLWPGDVIKKNLTEASIIFEVEHSLKRLGVDYIDLYQTHWPDINVSLEETYSTLLKLKKHGKIKHIGVCNVELDLLEEITKICPVASVQNEYSFLKTKYGDDVFEYCSKNNISFFAYGSLAGGILSGKYDKAPFFPKSDARSFMYQYYRGEAFNKAQAVAGRFKEVALKYNVPTPAAAIAWVMAQRPFIFPLVGAKTKEQIKQNALAAEVNLTKEDLDFLNGN